MNGRIYDPVIARMLSADPTVPNPSDLQAYNRYSYVLNNPLRYTDPSGFSSEEDKDQNEEIESSEDGGDLSESVTSETLNEGADVEGIPIRDSGIEIKDEEYSSGKTSYKTREISINGTVVSQQFAFRTENENGEEYSASGIQHVGFAQLGDTGNSFENKLSDNRLDVGDSQGIRINRANGDITSELSLNTEGVVDNWAFLSGSGTQAHEQANQGSGGFFGISLRDVGEFAVGFVPYGGAVVALSKGDFRGAAIEAAIETAIISVGALTGGAGYAVLKTARNAKRAAKATTISKRYTDAVAEATKRHNGNVTVQRDGVDLFRVHQPTSGHGNDVTQIVRRPRPADGKAFPTPREVPVRKTHVEQLERALKGDPQYNLRTRGEK